MSMRVVLIPGAMGSRLVEGSLTPAQAVAECRRNLPAVVDQLLRGSQLYPCDKRPELLWGGVGSLHWIFRPDAWERRMNVGNGLDTPGPVRFDGLVDVDLRFLGRRFTFQPYASLLAALRRTGCDVLVAPYDWRLSNRYNAAMLAARIAARWFSGRVPRRVHEDQRVTLIGHSMGGLVARAFVEAGWHRLTRRVITIGTPHLGAPQSYLHLIGRTLPLPENPFYRWASAVMAQQAAAAGLVGTQFLPARTQTSVLAHTAAAFELLPTYDFVIGESVADTYRRLVHTGTGRPGAQVHEEFRRGLVPVSLLAEWLGRHGIDYHLVAATGLPTTVGYDRRRDRILTGRGGDQTVPLASARPVPRSTGRLHVSTVDGGLGHQLLCQRPDIQQYCLDVLTSVGGGRRLPATAGPGATGRQRPRGPLQPDDLVAMARTILRNRPPSRGIVLSVTRLAGETGRPLVDSTTEPSGRPRGVRLANPPRHLSSPEVFEVESPRHGTFRYVWMLSNEQATFPVGGVVFLPRAGESLLHVVTFNVGQLDNRRCGNAHHAETQLTRWVREQTANWRAQVRIVLIQNRSRRPGPRGYSPCNACCTDLAVFLTELKSVPGSRGVGAGITWLEPYDRGAACGHPTDRANLDRLTASGWALDGPGPVQGELTLTRA
jgi:pimeloyl-ACP methyl ester carboxylesterase